MQEESTNSLYEVVIENSWNNSVDDYFKFIIENASKYTKTPEEAIELIDKVLKKILTNLKNSVEIEKYDTILINLGNYVNQDGYDFAIGLIRSFYRDEFKINNTEYDVLDMMNTIVEQYKTKDTPPIPEIFHYILASLFRIHYALYIREQK